MGAAVACGDPAAGRVRIVRALLLCLDGVGGAALRVRIFPLARRVVAGHRRRGPVDRFLRWSSANQSLGAIR